MSPIDLLPGSWRSELSHATIEPVPTGAGGASVFRVRTPAEVRFLKIATGKHAGHLRREIQRTAWLASQEVEVPAILQTVVQPDLTAVLMSAVPGVPVENSGLEPREIVNAVAAGLAKFHALPVGSCPFEESVAIRLARAEADVARG